MLKLKPLAAKPVVWTIAGSDSGGGAGVQADLLTIQDLGCHPCSVLTCLTAQSSVTVSLVEAVSKEMFSSQLNTLLQDLPPAAIKIGLLANQSQIFLLANWLRDELSNYQKRCDVQVNIILDPVMFATCGDALNPSLDFSPFDGLLTLITPNIAELAALVDKSEMNSSSVNGNKSATGLADQAACLQAAQSLSKQLSCNVLAKGGDLGPTWLAECSQDIFVCCDAKGSSSFHQGRSFLLSGSRIESKNTHGSGCTLSSAIASVLAQGYVLHDAVVVAKAYVTAGITVSYQVGKGAGPLARTGWPSDLSIYPKITTLDSGPSLPDGVEFLSIDERLGLYPVVDTVALLHRLLGAGAKTIQLRIKEGSAQYIDHQINLAVQLGRDYKAKLFINDHWEFALKHGAYGTHLGQEDLYSADLVKIAKAGMALGVSSHSYFELLLANQITPSYIALGHIFPTTTKEMPSAPQGLDKLKHYVALLGEHYPLVAIGGIDASKLAEVKQTQVHDVAVVRAVTQAEDPAKAYQVLSELWEACDATQ
ncbi:thiamine phosphate synthase [Shewanella sp. D64]|uniref:thiamine phosphate synthase n=1 Tax=unclassified Shewanella TaxID=196818 RepID=UPI0022BA5A70|nr:MULTISPECIES: thiamine phosphate synthase [unclassified Shewanella]MEC4725288.1 thiamine phosphate synthase [Shewanella sp. D64]MEC4735866.1 thiamine phosphate synthase [Shewanella sp. E94]WBJ98186.1 thiamine phosphate synthase [Shewanella sp. MTB7]